MAEADLSELSRWMGLSEPSSTASERPTMDFGEMSKTTASQQLRGNQSYYYWHLDAERRRSAGEDPVPAPIPRCIATTSTAATASADGPPSAARVKKPIESFSLYAALLQTLHASSCCMNPHARLHCPPDACALSSDDGDLIKIYIALEGELAGVTMGNVDAEFAERSLRISVIGTSTLQCFTVDRLMYAVEAAKCKAVVTKSGKLVVKLHKRNPIERWSKLRSA